jgi:hypothetical protein
MFYLGAALVWSAFTLFIVAWSWRFPEQPLPRIGGTGFSIAWFTGVLAVYNLIRWLRQRGRGRKPPTRDDFH